MRLKPVQGQLNYRVPAKGKILPISSACFEGVDRLLKMMATAPAKIPANKERRHWRMTASRREFF
jgi:hypothetical protein